MFEAAEAYERDMGHWSKKLAPLFLDWIGLKNSVRVLDVGCGTGSLTFVLAQTTDAGKIVGIDPLTELIEPLHSTVKHGR
jgi:ubiquinone/menaquinone biosynthesis C-methylase UbiE